MTRYALALLALAACDRVFGGSWSGDNSTTVTGQIVRDEVRNDATFSPQVMTSPAADLSLAAYLADGTRADIAYEPDGTFTFDTPDREPYRLVLRLATRAQDVELQQFSETVRLHMPHVSRTDSVALDGTEQIAIDAQGLIDVGDLAYFASSGVWAIGTVPAQLAQTFNFQETVPPAGQRIGRLDAAAYDRAYFALFSKFAEIATPDEVHYALRKYLEGSITVGSGTATLGGALQSVPTEALVCREIVPSARIEALRLQSLRSYDGIVVRWAIESLPAPWVSAFAGLLLAYSNQIVAQPSDISDTPTVVRVYDPFRGTAAFESLVVLQHHVQLGQAAPVSLSTVSSQIVLLGDDPACSDIGVTPSIGVPGPMSLAGQSLADDGATITLPADSLVELTWDLAIRGIGDVWSANLQRLVVDASNKTTLEPVYSWSLPSSSEERSFKAIVSRDVLVPGETYAIQLLHRSGYPAVREGDWSTIDYPSQAIIVWSGTFTVQ